MTDHKPPAGGSADLEVHGSRPVVVVRMTGAPTGAPSMDLSLDEAQVVLDDLEATGSPDPVLMDDLRDVLAIQVGECQFWSPCAEPALGEAFCAAHLPDGER
jgi:hypothetical protein